MYRKRIFKFFHISILAVLSSFMLFGQIGSNPGISYAQEVQPSIEVSLADGSSFSTETATVKITLKNAEEGVYCVDGGPTTMFSSSTEVVIGQGKIADSEVTLEVSTINAPGGPDRDIVKKTYTYKKEYVAGQSSAH